jgi:fibronectin-binding autotransporter adhesin
MFTRKHLGALAFVASAALITGSGSAITAMPAADAAPGHHAPAAHRSATSKTLSSSALDRVRDRQRQMLAQHRSAPAFARAAVTTFTVDTTEDSDLADSAGTTCVDAATGSCSLRAAVDAANNLDTPVRIVLGAHTYTLSTASALTVTDSKGVSVVGKGAGKTSIEGAGSGLFIVSANGDGSPATLFLSSLRLRHGESDFGGAVQLTDNKAGTLVLDHVRANDNEASEQGGALYAYQYNSIYISHSSFTGNHAPYGAAIYQNWADVSIQDTSFTENSTTAGDYGYGGAIDNEYGVFDMNGGSLSHNTAGDGTWEGDGGGIYDDYATTTLTNVHVDHNTASAGAGDGSGIGGAIFSYEDEIEFNGGTMSHNRAEGTRGAGGGLYSSENTQLTFTGVSMVGNKASGTTMGFGGGTFYLYGSQYPSQLVIDGGKITKSDHSAIYLQGNEGGVDASITNATLSGNSDDSPNGLEDRGCGGVLCIWGSGDAGMNLEMQGNHVSDNTSVGNSGSGAVSVYTSSTSTASVTLRKNTFSKNQSGASGNGGAVGFLGFQASPISVRMAANTFSHNRAGTQSGYGSGGALSMSPYTTSADRGSTFAHNSARGDGALGGAVLSDGQDSSTWSRTRFVGNSAGTNDDANAGYGGAVYSSNYAGEVFEQVTMSGNTAASQGGGFYGDGSTYQAVFKATTVSGNTAGTASHEGAGGGIYAFGAVLVVENSTLTGNKASSVSGSPGQGGALWYSGGRLGLRYSTVSGNYAHEGAGLYADIYGSVLGSILSKNKTSKSGSEEDCAASDPTYTLKSLGGNVLGQKGCVSATQASDKVSRKLHLGTLKDNGGPTKTIAISKKSPAVGRASYLVPGRDQRGHQRPNKHADAGAYELPTKR